jgi:hypothetical protein
MLRIVALGPVRRTTQFPAFAETIGDDVREAADEVAFWREAYSDDLGYIVKQQTHALFCQWFDWYLETGNTVPNESEFAALVWQYGFGLAAHTQPDDVPFLDAISRFRKAIVRTQESPDEATQIGAAAAACTIPGLP